MPNIITLGSLIDKTVEHYRDHFKELIGITLWLIVASAPFLFSSYIAPAGIDASTPTAELVTYLILNSLGAITTTLAALWIGTTLIQTIHARAQGQTPDHVALGKKAWKYVPNMFTLSFCIGVAVLLAAAALLLPGFLLVLLNHADGTLGAALGIGGVLLLFGGSIGLLYAIIRYSVEISFAQFFLVLEQDPKFSLKTLWKTVQSSRSVVRGSWRAVALRIFIPNAIISLIAFGITFVISVLTTLLLSLAAGSLSVFAVTLIAIGVTLCTFIINCLAMPLYSLATYYLYDGIKRS